jgi:F-type H+-transporting ATPase subunit c
MAQARATSSACEGLARNPGAAAPIRFALLLALVLIESMALYTFAIIFAKVK